jgi:Leucine-rich repeat (LRR) protein
VEIEHWSPDDDKDGVEIVHTPDPTMRAWWDAAEAVEEAARRERDLCGRRSLTTTGCRRCFEKTRSIEDQPLGTLEPLRKLVRVDYLNFENTGVTDLSPVSRLPRLRDLLIRENRIDLVSLAPAERLEELYIDRCGVSSLIGLERCRALREIHAEDNHVDDLRPLAELTELRVLDFEGNRVSDLTVLAGMTKLHTLELGLTRVTDLAPLAKCKALRVLEVWCTPTLANAHVLAELPELTTVISHGSIPKADIDELRRKRPRLTID